MDRQSIIGYVLIFVLLVVWMLVNTPKQNQQPQQSQPAATQPVLRDSVKRIDTLRAAAKEAPSANPLGKYFTGRDKGLDRTITVESDLYIADISLRGGVLKRW